MSGRSPVAISACGTYDAGRVAAALVEVLDPLGGMEAFVAPGQRVFLKINLLMRARPERAVTTHPEVVRAVVRSAYACGAAEVLVGDSPGGRTTPTLAKAAFEGSGIAAVCREEGARLSLLDEAVERVAFAGGRLYSAFNLGREAIEADVLINLPKLKTHGFMMMTGAVKNLFGCIPGLEKAQFHVKVPDRGDFADMLVDLLLACSPELNIMDAVVGMEGQGPSGGTPRTIGALLASPDAFALDAVAAAITGFEANEVYTIGAAARRGLGPAGVDDVEVAGSDWREFAVPDFVHPASDVSRKLPPPVARWVRAHTASLPFLERPADCTRCGTCRRDCPVGAIRLDDAGPVFDHDTCIRCYCCQELCPEQAIGLRTPWLVRAVVGRREGGRA